MTTPVLREDIRRDGLAMNFLLGESLMQVLASALPEAIINIGYPGICPAELCACQRITRALASYPVESAVVAHACATQIASLESVACCAQNTSVNVWVPCSERLIRQISPDSSRAFLESCIATVRSWSSTHSTPIDVALVDVTADEDGLHHRTLWIAEQCILAGCRHIIVGDSMGMATPGQLISLFRGLEEMGGAFEFHGHNDNGLLESNIQAAVANGACGIGSAAFGLGERKTMADSRRVAQLLSLPFDDSAYAEFANLHEGYRVAHPSCETLLNPDTIISGAQLRLRGSLPDTNVMFGVTSDRRILGEIMRLPPNSFRSDVLPRLKDQMYHEERCVLSAVDLAMYLETMDRRGAIATTASDIVRLTPSKDGT